jgi:glycosyltransferase involved in cell wall biosynthesis
MTTGNKNHDFDVIVVTNEMPLNRKGGVGSVIEGLASGFLSLGAKVLWLLVEDNYRDFEKRTILAEFPDAVIGSYDDLKYFSAPVISLHTYQHNSHSYNYLSRKKVVYTIHSLLICEAESNGVDLSGPILQQENLIAACDKIVLVSQAELMNYCRYGYQKINPNVTVIYNGLRNPHKFRNCRRNGVLGFCGRLVPRKRPEYVQMILKEEGFENYSALIAGRGFSPYARDLASDRTLENRIQYLGWCGGNRIESFYDAIDLLAIPSTYEPFGMVALEAVARGIPIVCNRVGGLVEILDDYAFYSEDETYSSFRKAINLWLAADDETIETMTRAALRRYYENFTDIMMAERYLNLFNCLS